MSQFLEWLRRDPNPELFVEDLSDQETVRHNYLIWHCDCDIGPSFVPNIHLLLFRTI